MYIDNNARVAALGATNSSNADLLRLAFVGFESGLRVATRSALSDAD